MISLKDIGKKIVCPKCRKEGVVRITRQRKKGREYLYLVVRHYNENRYCIIKRIDIESIEGIEDILKAVGELEDLKERLRDLEEENTLLEEENKRLRIENSTLRDRLGIYEELWRKSIVISRSERLEERIDEIRNLLKRYDGLRILPFRYEVRIEYGLESE